MNNPGDSAEASRAGERERTNHQIIAVADALKLLVDRPALLAILRGLDGLDNQSLDQFRRILDEDGSNMVVTFIAWRNALLAAGAGKIDARRGDAARGHSLAADRTA